MDDPKTRKDRDKPAASRAANALEIACVNGIQPTEPGCAYTFTRTFEHADWLDFESLVQAGKTPEESGINDASTGSRRTSMRSATMSAARSSVSRRCGRSCASA